MKYARQFLISVVAGLGSSIGAFIGREYMNMLKNEYKRSGSKKKAKTVKSKILKKEGES